MDPCLEIPVSRKDRGADKIVLDDRILDSFVKGAGIADAGSAAVGGYVKTRVSRAERAVRLS